MLRFKTYEGVFMNALAKVCITGLAGVGVCSTAPAWATVIVVTVVVAGAVSIAKS